MSKIAYLKHPLSAEKKAEFRGKGFQILDIAFKPEETGKDDFLDQKAKQPAKKSEK